jgi:hypothetical protein
MLAEIRFTLDVDEPGLPERYGGRDARRFTESVAANFENREAVHLSDPRADGIDENLALFDHLANLGFSEIVALDLGVERFANMLAGHRM